LLAWTERLGHRCRDERSLRIHITGDIVVERRGFWLAASGGVFLGADLALFNTAVWLRPTSRITVIE